MSSDGQPPRPPGKEPIEGGGDAEGNEPTLPLPAIEVERRGSGSSQLSRQVAIVAAVGAVAMLAVVSAVAGTSGADDTATRLEELCTEHLGGLADAIEDWDGVENWADAVDPSPDLGLLTVSALEDFGSVSSTAELAGTASDLSQRLDDAASPGDRSAALHSALDQAGVVLGTADTPSACAVARIDEARDRG